MRPVWMNLKRLAGKRRRGGTLSLVPFDRKEGPVDPVKQAGEATLIRSRQNDDTATLIQWESSRFEKSVVQTDECSPQLACHPKVLDVGSSSQRIILYHRQHIPLQAISHVLHDTSGNVGIGINPRLPGECPYLRTKLGSDRTQHYASEIVSSGTGDRVTAVACRSSSARSTARW